MKTLVSLLILSCMLIVACSAENPISNDAITKASLQEQWERVNASLKKDYSQENLVTVDNVDGMPQIIGGMMTIANKIKYAEEAVANKIEGRVVVEFVVNEEGNVIDASVVRGIGYGCDESALLAISSTKFTPPSIEGKPTKVKMTLPIVFKLQ